MFGSLAYECLKLWHSINMVSKIKAGLLAYTHAHTPYTLLHMSYESAKYFYWQVKNIAMEILDFYENHRMITEERINVAFAKLPYKM